MKRVIIESPYAGDTERNVRYARACVRDSVLRGEAPIASHLLFTQQGILNDDILAERSAGIAAGHAWMSRADLCAVYTDLGLSEGMKRGIERAFAEQTAIEFRTIEPCKWCPDHPVRVTETKPEGGSITRCESCGMVTAEAFSMKSAARSTYEEMSEK